MSNRGLRDKSVLLVHPTGNANVRADIRALARAQRLSAFYTTVSFPTRLAEHRFLPSSFREQLGRRAFPEAGDGRVVQFPLREAVRLAARKARLGILFRHEVGWASVDAVYRSLDRQAAMHLREARINASIVYCYEDGALETFRAARISGLRTVYHLPIAYWACLDALLEEERQRWPEWQATMIGLKDSAEKRQRKDKELAEADRVIVASSFTRRSLGLYPHRLGHVHVIPYGAPPARSRTHSRPKGAPLRVLFVGQLSQRKGLADLDQAMKRVRGLATLSLVGSKTSADCAALDRLIGACTWFPGVTHSRVLDLMCEHDVLVVPSIAEGFGLVITEALSCGLPVITTPHTAGPDLITDGRDGFIIPIRAPDAIASRLAMLADDPELLMEMSAAASDLARKNPWRRYEDSVIRICTDDEI